VVHNSCELVVCAIEQIEQNGQIIECEVCRTETGEISRTCRVPECDPNTIGSDCVPPPPPCDSTTSSADPNSNGVAPSTCVERLTVWFDPVQCGGNPWERTASNEPALDQLALVRTWLESLGVTAFSIRFEQIYDATCDACQCPRGDRLFVETDEAGARVLMQFGFQL